MTQPHLVREQTVTQEESPIRLRFVPVPFEVFPKTLSRSDFCSQTAQHGGAPLAQALRNGMPRATSRSP